ncbi:MAG: PQQ-binding-like beta-propeller repeat protein [Actinomycetota bacterium]
MLRATALGALAVVSGLVPAIPTSAATAPAPVPCAPLSSVNDRCPVWGTEYDYPGGRDNLGLQEARALAMSPSGSRVYVTGAALDDETFSDASTQAYDAATGALLWSARHDGPKHQGDGGWGIAVAPDGSQVFVTGTETVGDPGTGAQTIGDFVTIAYDAATGAERWVARYAGPDGGDDRARFVVVSSEGSRVYVAGYQNGSDVTVVAYDTTAGDQVWVTRYGGADGSLDSVSGLAVAPDGSTVYVAGSEAAGLLSTDPSRFLALALSAGTGHERWVAHYQGPGAGHDLALGLALSSDGSRIFVTGQSKGTTTDFDFATAAFDASDGETLWTARYDGGAVAGLDRARAVAVSPDGRRVFVTGESIGEVVETPRPPVAQGLAVATVAYDASTGAQQWAARYHTTGHLDDEPRGIVANGSRVFVTGFSAPVFANDGQYSGFGASSDGDAFVENDGAASFLTLAYESGSGIPSWTALWTRTPGDSGVPRAAALSADGRRLFIAGTFARPFGYNRAGNDTVENYSDAWTLAYDTP